MCYPFVKIVVMALSLLPALCAAGSEFDSVDWSTHGHDYKNQRYSSLKQISLATIEQLTEVGFYPADSQQARQQTTPIVVDGVIYFSVPFDRVVALDMKTGQTLWSYQYDLDWHEVTLCCGPVNRGVAVDTDRVYVATLNATVIALDKLTGQVIWQTQSADAEQGYSYTLAPLVVDGKVIVGSAGGEFGIRGFVDAYDAKTGERIWRFWTIPSPEEGGWWGDWVEQSFTGDQLNRNIDQEKADKEKYTDAWQKGGGPVWTTPAYDQETGLLYIGTGNPSPDIDARIRPGDNLYSNSIIALDIKTGKRRWYQQLVPHDRWDYDVASPLVLHSISHKGILTPVVSHAAKTGWLYTLDRMTGELINRSDNFVPQKNMFITPGKEEITIYPGDRGGANWAAPAWSPKTQLFFLQAQHIPRKYLQSDQAYEQGVEWLGGQMRDADLEQWGAATAIDPASGKVRWQFKTQLPLWTGGMLATESGLVFFSESSGKFRALNAETGKVLWEHKVKAGVYSAPITFALGGKQYILLTSNKGLHFFALKEEGE